MACQIHAGEPHLTAPRVTMDGKVGEAFLPGTDDRVAYKGGRQCTMPDLTGNVVLSLARDEKLASQKTWPSRSFGLSRKDHRTVFLAIEKQMAGQGIPESGRDRKAPTIARRVYWSASHRRILSALSAALSTPGSRRLERLEICMAGRFRHATCWIAGPCGWPSVRVKTPQ